MHLMLAWSTSIQNTVQKLEVNNIFLFIFYFIIIIIIFFI